MKKILINSLVLFLLIGIFSCRTGVQEYPEKPVIIVDGNGEDIHLSWNTTDNATIRYRLCYGEITHWRSGFRIGPPDNVQIVNDVIECWNVGFAHEATFKLPTGRFWFFQLQGWDTPASSGFEGNYAWSDSYYYPYNPFPKGSDQNPRIDDPWHGYLYDTYGEITLGWDHSGERTTHFEIKKVYQAAQDVEYFVGNAGLNERSITFSRIGPVGMYVFYIRACNSNTDLCSEWASSDNSEFANVTIGGQEIQGNWKLFWRLSPPTWN